MNKIFIESEKTETADIDKFAKLFLALIISELNKKEYAYIWDNLKDLYNISKKKFLLLLKRSIKISRVKNTYVIYFDNNIKTGNGDRFVTLIDAIEYGNRQVKGTGIVKKSSDYIYRNMTDLRIMFAITERSNIWQ